MSNILCCKAGYDAWNIHSHIILEMLIGSPPKENILDCKTYVVFDRIENRTYYGDLVVKMKNEFKKKSFLENILTKEPKPRGNFFSLKRIFLIEGVVSAVENDGFENVYQEKMFAKPEKIQSNNRNHFIAFCFHPQLEWPMS